MLAKTKMEAVPHESWVYSITVRIACEFILHRKENSYIPGEVFLPSYNPT